MRDARPTTSETNGSLWGQRAQDWANLQELQCRPVFEQAFVRLGMDLHTDYLDAGCGAGLAAQMASALGCRVSGLDASEAMLRIARKRVPAADLRQGELEHLPFESASFDIVTGFNSFQYAANPEFALREAARVVRPSGRLLVMTWNRPEGMAAAALVAALKPLLPPLAEGLTPPPGPFSLSDQAALREFATSAGLEPIDMFDVDSPWHYASLASALRGLGSSGVAAAARAWSGEAAVDSAHAAALTPFRHEDGSYTIAASFRCLIAMTFPA